MRISLTILAAAGILAVSAGAQPAGAQPVDGLYVGAGAGYNFMQDETATIDVLPGRTVGASGVQASAPMKVKWGDGYGAVGAVGWGFGNGLRLEVEGDYRTNTQLHGGGRATEVGVMGNALYDFDPGLGWVFPYVGVGVGYQSLTWGHVSGQASGIDVASPTNIGINDTVGSFAYQFIAGLAVPIPAVPGLSLTAEYRYMTLAGARSFRAQGSTPGVSGFASGATRAKVNQDGNHTILVGLRYAFGEPESAPVERPPPMPVPAPEAARAIPAPARTYLVFFDWDSADLTPRAREIIAEAARNAPHVTYTRIEVAGHADRSGTAQGNLALSRRRAEAVAGELERGGVPAGAIEIHAFGDTKPLVPTAAGVREPQNRRVEIVYQAS